MPTLKGHNCQGEAHKDRQPAKYSSQIYPIWPASTADQKSGKVVSLNCNQRPVMLALLLSISGVTSAGRYYLTRAPNAHSEHKSYTIDGRPTCSNPHPFHNPWMLNAPKRVTRGRSQGKPQRIIGEKVRLEM